MNVPTKSNKIKVGRIVLGFAYVMCPIFFENNEKTIIEKLLHIILRYDIINPSKTHSGTVLCRFLNARKGDLRI